MKTARIVLIVTIIIFVTLINLGVTSFVWYNLNVVPLTYPSNVEAVSPVSSELEQQEPEQIYRINQDDLWYEIQYWKKRFSDYEYQEHEVLCEYTDRRLRESTIDFNHLRNGWYQEQPLKIFKEVSENLARDCGGECLGGWLLSPKHAQALTRNYKYSCLRCNETNCVQLFAN